MSSVTAANEVLLPSEEVGLEILGISTDQLPSVELFPVRFNQSALRVWVAVLEDPATLSAFRQLTTNEAKWQYCVAEYLKRCNKIGLFAFSALRINTNNDIVVAHLMRLRIRLASFYKRTGFFTNGQQLGRLTRHYDFSNGTMTLTVSAYLKPSTIDPTFQQFLMLLPEPRFKRDTGTPGLYVKRLAANLNLFVRFYNRQRVQVGYSIFCKDAPFAGNSATPQDKYSQTRFVEEQIWVPLVRKHRIVGVGPRIF